MMPAEIKRKINTRANGIIDISEKKYKIPPIRTTEIKTLPDERKTSIPSIIATPIATNIKIVFPSNPAVVDIPENISQKPELATLPVPYQLLPIDNAGGAKPPVELLAFDDVGG
jgi:hypothetical protein